MPAHPVSAGGDRSGGSGAGKARLQLNAVRVSAVFSKRVIMAESRAFFIDCCLVKGLIAFCDVSGLAELAGVFRTSCGAWSPFSSHCGGEIGAFCMWLEGSVGDWHWCLCGALQGPDAGGHVLTAAGPRVVRVCPASVRNRNDLLHLCFR